MIKIILWDMSDAALIVPRQTGVLYSNQVGGTACLQPSLEGILVPIALETPLEDQAHALPAMLGKIFEDCADAMENAHADAVDSVMASCIYTQGITVDRSRMADSCESWVYVQLVETEYGPIKGIAESNAVLTWPNSD